jgi:hypothetical protein
MEELVVNGVHSPTSWYSSLVRDKAPFLKNETRVYIVGLRFY